MRVAIDLLIAEKERGGLLFATRALLEGLARIDHTNEYILITARPKDYKDLATAPSIRIHAVKLLTWRGILIQHQLRLPEILRKIKPDVLHVPAFAAPIGWNGPLVVTIHDLAFLKVPQQSSLYARLYWQYLLRESVRRAQNIISISEQTSEELRSLWSIDDKRIHLIYNALRPSLHLESIATDKIESFHQQYGARYLLHVGRIMPRKNVEMLIAAFDLLAEDFPDLHLVLVGGRGHASESILDKIEKTAHKDRIHQAGWVADEDMGALYAGAEALVVPSKHEGFGLPALESMACGTPVIASFEAASQAIFGDAVKRVDCSNATPLADAIRNLITDRQLRERLSQLGRKQIEPFTCENCAHATQIVYQKSCALQPSPVYSNII